MNATVQTIQSRSDGTIATVRSRQSLDTLRVQLRAIHADLLRLEHEFEPQLAGYAVHKKSVRNLIHYLALRRHDIRRLQEQLAAPGLSSLGRTESHVLAGIEAVLKVLHQLDSRAWVPPHEYERGVEFAEGRTCQELRSSSQDSRSVFASEAVESGRKANL